VHHDFQKFYPPTIIFLQPCPFLPQDLPNAGMGSHLSQPISSKSILKKGHAQTHIHSHTLTHTHTHTHTYTHTHTCTHLHTHTHSHTHTHTHTHTQHTHTTHTHTHKQTNKLTDT
jgi:hypothetical protein